MWLINTDTLKLEFFTPPKLPEYAILSHTWGEGKVSLQDISNLENAKKKAGFFKISEDFAELSESINSMYKWYQQSEICYAFLEDWSPEWDWADLSPLAYDEISTGDRWIIRERTTSDGYKASPLKWFTRGWTLQELIAPAKVQFYDSKWSMRGSKSDRDDLVAEYLSGITGIRLDILVNGSESALRRVPIGQRMSWAAHRETTRTEDLAYCLLGIFQVNMPMLYGEGKKAFLRLQEEIIKSSTDLSIFAWLQDPDDNVDARGVLSHHPH
ncbi:heterokaryon incompatibility domain containing protein [Rhypophila decipiens]